MKKMANLVKDIFKDYKEDGNIINAEIENINLFKKSKKLELELKSEESIKINEISKWNNHVTFNMRDGAKETLIDLGASEEDVKLYQVPGSFELVYGADKLAKAYPEADRQTRQWRCEDYHRP